jgi:hypothetical protein
MANCSPDIVRQLAKRIDNMRGHMLKPREQWSGLYCTCPRVIESPAVAVAMVDPRLAWLCAKRAADR